MPPLLGFAVVPQPCNRSTSSQPGSPTSQTVNRLSTSSSGGRDTPTISPTLSSHTPSAVSFQVCVLKATFAAMISSNSSAIIVTISNQSSPSFCWSSRLSTAFSVMKPMGLSHSFPGRRGTCRRLSRERLPARAPRTSIRPGCPCQVSCHKVDVDVVHIEGGDLGIRYCNVVVARRVRGRAYQYRSHRVPGYRVRRGVQPGGHDIIAERSEEDTS